MVKYNSTYVDRIFPAYLYGHLTVFSFLRYVTARFINLVFDQYLFDINKAKLYLEADYGTCIDVKCRSVQLFYASGKDKQLHIKQMPKVQNILSMLF